MKKILIEIGLIVLGFNININAQEIDSSKLKLNYANVIKIVPLNFIDISSPNAAIDLEHYISKKISIQFEAAYFLSHFIIKSNDTKGYKLQTEVRRNLQSFNLNHNYYAFHVSYVTKDYSWMNDLIDQSNLSKGYPITNKDFMGLVKREKQTFSFNFKYGRQVYKKHFILDYFIGGGPKYKMVKTIFPGENLWYYGDSLQWWYRDDTGNFWTINIVANIKVGYRF